MSIIAAGTTTTTALSSTGNTDGTLQLQVNGTTPSVTLNTLGAIGVGSTPNYGTSGQALVSAGSTAAPTWANVTTSPAGSNTQIQYNNSGSFGASSALTFDGSQLSVNGGASGIPLTLNNNTGSNTNLAFSEGGTAKWYLRNITGDGGFSFYNLNAGTESYRFGPLGQLGIGGTNYGTSGQVLTSGGSGAAPTWSTPASGGSKTWTSITSSTTYTVPAGVSSIRVYAFGKGGNGYYVSSSGGGGGGGGGGCAYGDIAVTAGASVTVSISGGVATVTYGGTTMLTANPGSDSSSNTGGAGGTASKHASVTNGGAYSGGAGGSNGGGQGSGGGSSGSPLGAGYAPSGIYTTGGAGWNSGPSSQGGGNGGGSNGTIGGFLQNGCLAPPGATRSFETQYTETLLAAMNLTGIGGLGAYGWQNYTQPAFVGAQPGQSGGGGGGVYANGTQWAYMTQCQGGAGGNGSGGGACDISRANYGGYCYGGTGGFGGGGGGSRIAYDGSSSNSFYIIGGAGGYGGGGGGACGNGYSYAGSNGTGGAAIVLIYA